jgi:tetratricopeptide (TPR) repeat protein
MSDHPTPDQIFRFLGSQTALEGRGIARHLFECAACRGVALAALRPEATPAPAAKVLAHPRAGGAQAAAVPWRAKLRQAVREVEQGQGLIAELTAYPRDRWRLLVPNRRKLHTLVVAQFILEESRVAAFDDPRLAVELAEVAAAVLRRLDPAVYGDRLLADVRGRAWVAIGGGRRLAGDLAGAEAALRRAGRLLAGSADPVELGGYLLVLGGLRKDQRRFAEAGEHLQRSAALFQEGGDEPKAVRALVAVGLLYVDEGNPAEALPPLLEALERLDEEEDPRAALAARHNLALCLAELGEWQEARRLHARLGDAYARSGDAHARVRGRWLEGILAAGHGEDARAEELFREVGDAFRAGELAYDAALVSLDLAMLLARQGRGDELRALAEEMAGTFLSREVHREAAAAVAFFRHAVAQDRASAELVAGIARYLKRARLRPGLPFAPAG